MTPTTTAAETDVERRARAAAAREADLTKLRALPKKEETRKALASMSALASKKEIFGEDILALSDAIAAVQTHLIEVRRTMTRARATEPAGHLTGKLGEMDSMLSGAERLAREIAEKTFAFTESLSHLSLHAANVVEMGVEIGYDHPDSVLSPKP